MKGVTTEGSTMLFPQGGVASKPRILFAGEATHPTSWSTVHGARGTGIREAERLIKFYSN